MKIFYLFFAIALIGAVYSCSYNEYVDFPVEEPVDSVLFKTTIEPMFQSDDIGCTSCHPSYKEPDLTTGNAYASIMKNGLVDKDSAENSKIYNKPYPDDHHGKKYNSQQALYILTWIKEGAHDN